MRLVFAGTVLTLTANLAIGLATFLGNRRRAVNQIFLTICVVLEIWLLLLLVAFTSRDAEAAAHNIRLLSGVVAAVPFLLNCLRLAIVHPTENWYPILRRSRFFIWAPATAGIFAMCQTRFFLECTVLPGEGLVGAAIFEPVYGAGIHVYSSFYIVALTTLMVLVVRDAHRLGGIRRVELQFVLMGASLGGLVAALLTVGFPAVLKTSQTAKLAPLAVFVFDTFVAYGIATRRVMEVGHILRFTTSYAVLGTYLSVLYIGVWFGVRFLFGEALPPDSAVPHLLAALALVASMMPAHGQLQRRVTHWLFGESGESKTRRLVQQASVLLRSVGTLESLLNRFAGLLTELLGAERVAILFEQDGQFTQAFPPPPRGEPGLLIPRSHPVTAALSSVGSPLVREVVLRSRPSASLDLVSQWMLDAELDAVVSMRAKGRLEGLVLLGPRRSGQVYSLTDQNALQIVTDQLAVAVENARLYTQVQDSKTYNDILVEHLVSGVIAVNYEGIVTVFNREAQRITCRPADEVIEHGLQTLPAPLRESLEQALAAGREVRNQETVIPGADEGIPVQVGSSVLSGHKGDRLGALIVFTDMSTVRRLEDQVRRTAHLASLGTLSAGMAHEIKNPLVTLKTFTQLLQERYTDAEFRDSFAKLADKEIGRIDSIVNQLLNFGRPAKARLGHLSLRDVLQESIALVHGPVRQKGIQVYTQWGDENDDMQGDARQLEQAFVNFLLNAVDSMDRGGQLTVRTLPDETLETSAVRSPERIYAAISDTGPGIAPADVQSEPGKGTTFLISFPRTGPTD